jgi:hypothetical protein
MHKLEFRPVINGTPNNVNQWKGQAVIKIHVFDLTYIFPAPLPDCRREFEGTVPTLSQSIVFS